MLSLRTRAVITRESAMATKEPISKSKAKRLKKKAKSIRIETALNQEKKLRETAELSTKHWKQKATLYKRFVTKLYTNTSA